MHKNTKEKGIFTTPKTPSNRYMGVVGLEPTESEDEGFTVGLQVYVSTNHHNPEQRVEQLFVLRFLLNCAHLFQGFRVECVKFA